MDTGAALEPNWNALIALLPMLSSPDFSAGEWHAPEGTLPYFELSAGGLRVNASICESGVVYPFDWTAWQEEGHRLQEDPEALAAADLVALRKLLTMHVRMDRFVEGHFGEVLRSGHIKVVIARVAERYIEEGIGRLLNAVRIERALPRVAKGLSQYLRLQTELRSRDVSSDCAYRKAFTAFYRVRRNDAWRDAFFELLERHKSGPVSFGQVLADLQARTGRIEASFASKLVATIDDTQPVIDAVVMRNLRLVLPTRTAPDRLTRLAALHAAMYRGFRNYLSTAAGRDLVTRFRAAYPDGSISEVKMLDLVLWQTRTTESPAA